MALAERTSERSTPLAVTSRPAHQLRAQRLLRSGLVAETSQFDTPESPTIDRAGFDLVAEAVPTSSAIESVDAPSVPVIARSMAVAASVQTPSLARIDSSASTVVRRVTLPRALSSAHRPAAYFDSVGAPDLTGTARSAGPVSTVTLARAATSRASATVSTRSPSGAGSPASWSPRAPAGSSALLDAIRRSATVDATARIAPAGHESIDAHSRFDTKLPSGSELVRRTDFVSPDNRIDDAPLVNRTDHATSVNRTVELTPSVDRVDDAPSEHRVKPSAVTGASVVAARHGAVDHPQRARTEFETLRPAERVAQQFMTVLSETVRRRPAPLPTTFRPLADAIAGPRPVMLSTDAASRKALRSVGKVAATTGDTIHLDSSAVSAARLDEVMAHELTHVAHPSPTPRFFDDIDDSPEERRAEQVARVMARSPLAPSATTSAPSVRRSEGSGTIRRSAASSTPPSTQASVPSSVQRASSPGTVSAQSLAAGLTASGTSSNVVQRWGADTPSAESSQGAQLGSHRSAAAPAPADAPQRGRTSDELFGPGGSVEWFREQLDDNLDRLVRLLEDRMIVELERRGGRAWRQS